MARSASACSCSAPLAFPQRVRKASLVVEADVLSTVADGTSRTTSVVVTTAYRGAHEGDHLDVHWIEPDGKSCFLVQVTTGHWLFVKYAGPNDAFFIGRCDADSTLLDGTRGEALRKQLRAAFPSR